MDIESLIAVVVVAKSITRLAKAIESLDPDDPAATPPTNQRRPRDDARDERTD